MKLVEGDFSSERWDMLISLRRRGIISLLPEQCCGNSGPLENTSINLVTWLHVLSIP